MSEKEISAPKKGDHKISVTGILGVVLCIMLSLMLICNLTIVIKGTLYPEKPPSVLGVTPMVVLSGSMSGDAQDHIEVGDLIFIGNADADSLQEGDVIAFMDGSVVITHRIIAVEQNSEGQPIFTTKGDANNAPDQRPVTELNLIGKYLGRIPKVGDFAIFLQTPLGMVLFIGIPMIGFILYDVIRRQKDAAREKQRSNEMEEELARLRALTEKLEQQNPHQE
jgi:signal peptidase